MGTVYILGAGFSKTCGIATDLEMLDELNPRLKCDLIKGVKKTTIDILREQCFHSEPKVGFECFMATLSSLKFFPELLELNRNFFQEFETELQDALREYLKSRVNEVAWTESKGKTILEFVNLVDWEHDFILTFNYDLLLENALEESKRDVADRIIHLHGAIGEETLAWPTYIKFVHDETKKPLAPRWKKAFNILRHKEGKVDKLVFVGYSMPPSDLEAKSLFNYTDWYNEQDSRELPKAKDWYAYGIEVVNPDNEKIETNYKFFCKTPKFIQKTLEEWLSDWDELKQVTQTNVDNANVIKYPI